jgi:hypothetical protein
MGNVQKVNNCTIFWDVMLCSPLLASYWSVAWLTLCPLRWRQCGPVKYQWASTRVRGITFQRIVLFIVTAVRTSNLAKGSSEIRHCSLSYLHTQS